MTQKAKVKDKKNSKSADFFTISWVFTVVTLNI